MLKSLDRFAGPVAALIVVAVLSIGTYANFALPYWGGTAPQGCYFGDALIVFIDCGEGVPAVVDPVLTWSWYLTWGVFWLLAFFVPWAPVLGLPVLIAWLGLIILALRWGWQTLKHRPQSG